MKEAIFLDSNIFMYAAGKPHIYQEPCIQIVKDVELKNLSAVINTEILQELLYRYSQIGLNEKGIQLCRIILNFPLLILPVTESDVRLAVKLYPEFLKFNIKTRDIIHSANLKNNGIIQIISADKHFSHFNFLERIDPLEYLTKR